MKELSRRQFIQGTGLLAAATFIPAFFEPKKQRPLLSFSTLGCPDWDFNRITAFARQHQYDGIELRGLLHQMDLTKCPQFDSPNHIAGTLSVMKDNGLAFVDLGSSASLHLSDLRERTKNLNEAKSFIDLAEKIGCPFVRVFPNEIPKDQDKNETMELIANGLMELGDYAKGSHVSVLMETHGDLVWSDDLRRIMVAAYGVHTGLVWDVTNMWSVTKEPPEEVYGKLKKYIRHTHIKDLKMSAGKEHYVLLGQGDVPVFTAIDALRKGGYGGYYSFEWEKLWHPEIADSAVALGQYAEAMRQHFGETSGASRS